jgi:sarcosine oxidase delta subunit
MPLRCPSCNKFRSAEEFEAEDVELTDIAVEGDKVYGRLTATVNVICPECGEVIGTLEVSDAEVELGNKGDIEQA